MSMTPQLIKLTERQKLRLGELLTFKRIITELYPSGIVSIVSDTMDFWNCVNPDGGIVATLKEDILARNGKTVIRPDSGDPVKIVTGYMPDEYYRSCDDGVAYEHGSHKELTELEVKGSIQCLWDIFGGSETSTGYKQLDPHIGLIYGDSITIERATQICERLAAKGFASTNLVYGIGSFTYQGAVTPDAIVTRDTHGFAVKSTYGEVFVESGDRVGIEIFKDPKTDDGLKKSAKGITAVYEEDGEFILKDQATWEEFRNCAFQPVFQDGVLTTEWTLDEIRERVAKNF